MRYKKGQSGNPDGKPIGTKSKKTLAWDELGDYIISGGAKRYLEIIKKLSEKDFINRFETIMEYFKPKQQRTIFEGELELKEPRKIKYSDEQ